jgi:hypothetical protein
MGALWFGLALLCCVQAQAQDSEHHAHRHRRSSDSAEADSDSDESAHERRKRRREERARRKAEEAAEESAASADDGAQGGSKPDPHGKAEAPAAAATEPSATEPAPPEPPAYPPVMYVPRMAGGPAPYAASEVINGEGALDVKRLPAADTLDFASATPEQLRKLDGRMGLTLEDMQASDLCQALRTASRVPMRSWLTREHQREILVMAGLFVAALLMAFGFNSRAMRAIAPMVPFLACLYVGYDMMARADGRVDSIAKGLRACSATLGEGKIGEPKVVREHFELLTRVRDNITAAYERENRLVARVMDEYRM